jgi:hypothetical protein
MLSLYSASRSRWFGREDRRGWSMVEIGEMPGVIMQGVRALSSDSSGKNDVCPGI